MSEAKKPGSRGDLGAKPPKIVGGIVVAVLWLAMFVLPSACIIAAGKPRWLALAVGLAAFPIAPLGWHVFGEWRRKKKAKAAAAAKDADTKTPKTTLTGWDRLLLRTAVIAIVAIGGTIFAMRAKTIRAVAHNALWFTDWSDPDPITDSPLLRRVPADAEHVIWIRRGDTKSFLPLALSGQLEMVLAVRGDETLVVMAAEPGDCDQMETLVRLQNGKLELVDAPKGMRVLVTPGWKGAARGSPLLEHL